MEQRGVQTSTAGRGGRRGYLGAGSSGSSDRAVAFAAEQPDPPVRFQGCCLLGTCGLFVFTCSCQFWGSDAIRKFGEKLVGGGLLDDFLDTNEARLTELDVTPGTIRRLRNEKSRHGYLTLVNLRTRVAAEDLLVVVNLVQFSIFVPAPAMYAYKNPQFASNSGPKLCIHIHRRRYKRVRLAQTLATRR